MFYFDPKMLAFLASYLALTVLLVFGIRTVKGILKSNPTLARSFLTEPHTPISQDAAPPAPAPGTVKDAAPEDLDKGSFSRVAGAFGAMVLCAVIGALAYWILYALIFDNAALTHISGLGTYFVAAASLFAPYAVNQLRDGFGKN
jgi:hypothetical protein